MGNEISTASCWTANESPKASALMMMMTTTERTTTTATSKQEQSNSSSSSNSKYHHHHKKKLLFGCQTDEEHDEYVKEVCSAIANKRGQDGLSILGLEFHKWHHPKTCTCTLPASSSSSSSIQQQQQKKQDKDKENELVTTTMTTSHDLTTKETFTTVCSSSTVEEEDEKQRQRQKTKVVYRRDVSSLSRDDDDDDDDDDSISKELTFVDTTTTKEEEEEFMVPIGEPISRENSMADLNQAITFGSRMGSERSASTAFTMFSLATHHSYISGGDGSSSSSSDGRGGDNGDGNYYGSSSGSDNFETCSIRLYHKSTNTCITEKNHEFFIAHGKMYDEVARLCMEYAQDIMIQEGELEWQHVGDGVGALVSRNRRRRCLQQQQQQQLQKNKKKPVLLIVTGKGKVRAGIFSRRHLMTSGLEVSTALPFIRGANERNMNVIMLDPNVNGTQKAMKAVQSSLEKLFFDQQQDEEEEESTTTNTNTCNDKEDLYILAHSMAGSQLTRFLHDNTFIKKDDNNPRSSTSPTTASRIIPKNIKAGKDFLRQIKRVSFTDSNHNINWCKKNPPVTELLVGEASLYIKSHKPHDEKKQLGQLHHDCQFWKHRFGTIKTIWGGTSEHALTNYTGRDYIWDHFDSFLDDDE